ncbi:MULTISPECIES: hypothetical protein [Bacteria]|uniref:hypothetical protein n=1 Tax=Bacteria TaxID=2 RepID=UPI003C7DBB2E
MNKRVLSDGRAYRLFRPSTWWLEDEGLDGWYTPPAPRATSDPVPDGDGGYWPSRFLLSPRTVTIRGAHVAETSTLARAAAEDWLASLDGEFPVVVEDEHGAREITAFQSAAPTLKRLDDYAVAFSLIVTAPDPIKYGRRAAFSGDHVENAGGTPVLPWRIVTSGRATRINVSLAGHRIRWVGNSQSITIDLRTGTARDARGSDVTMGLIEDDVPLLPPGRSPLVIDSDAAHVAVEVRPGWR